jgi:hypothetical protein
MTIYHRVRSFHNSAAIFKHVAFGMGQTQVLGEVLKFLSA